MSSERQRVDVNWLLSKYKIIIIIKCSLNSLFESFELVIEWDDKTALNCDDQSVCLWCDVCSLTVSDSPNEQIRTVRVSENSRVYIKIILKVMAKRFWRTITRISWRAVWKRETSASTGEPRRTETSEETNLCATRCSTNASQVTAHHWLSHYHSPFPSTLSLSRREHTIKDNQHCKHCFEVRNTIANKQFCLTGRTNISMQTTNTSVVLEIQ